MDEDPNFDYEMDPQAVYSTVPDSAEEVMDEVGSEGMPMSDAGMHSEPIDKASFDVDFQDSANPQHASSDIHFSTDPTEPEPTSYIADEQIVEISQGPFQNHIYETTTNTSEPFLKAPRAPQAPQVAFSTAQTEVQTDQEGNTLVMSNAASNGKSDHHEVAGHWSSNPVENHEEYAGEEEEQDELNQGGETASANDLAVPATTVIAAEEEEEESDQLEAGREQEQQPSGEEAEAKQEVDGSGAEGYYHADEHEVSTVRVTFNGQDFVMWSSTDIPAYIALPTKPQETVPGVDPDNAHELVQVEAPALDVQQDVLWQPLDSLFAGLRERKALGDFLEETQELHLHFPDLDLDVAEDNLYCRELTLDDLLQLHHGLGLETSLHVQVSERPRFITKYNELAQHVAGILGNQLQHSSDDEDELANAGHPETHLTNQVGGDEAPSHGSLRGDGSSQDASNATQANLPSTTEAPSTLEEPKAGAIRENTPEAHNTDAPEAISLEAAGGLESSEVRAEEQSLHQGANETDAAQEEQDELDGAAAKTKAEQQEGAEPDEEGDEEEVTHHQHEVDQQAEQEGGAEEEEIDLEAEEEDGDEEEYRDEVEGEEYEGEAEGEDYEDQAEAEEYEEQAEAEADEYEGYADEAEDVGEEAEQTFFTSINEGSEAEEDELEEPEQSTVQEQDAASRLHNAEAASTSESTTAYNAGAKNEQGTSESLQKIFASKPLANDPVHVHEPRHLFSTLTDGTEEQIVEYTEEESEQHLDASPPSLATSTSYDTATQRKRSFVEEEDTAEYEEDERETESKRVKVD